MLNEHDTFDRDGGVGVNDVIVRPEVPNELRKDGEELRLRQLQWRDGFSDGNVTGRRENQTWLRNA